MPLYTAADGRHKRGIPSLGAPPLVSRAHHHINRDARKGRPARAQLAKILRRILHKTHRASAPAARSDHRPRVSLCCKSASGPVCLRFKAALICCHGADSADTYALTCTDVSNVATCFRTRAPFAFRSSALYSCWLHDSGARLEAPRKASESPPRFHQPPSLLPQSMCAA